MSEIEGIQEYLKSPDLDLRTDETGAEKEDFYHKELGRMIDEVVDFKEDKSAVIKENKDVFIIKTTNRGLAIANSLAGHEAGDKIIKETFLRFGEILSLHTENPKIYHTYASDYISILELSPKVLETVTNELSSEVTYFQEDLPPTEISVSGVRFQEIADVYNQIQEKPETYYGRKKLFAGIAIKLADLKMEKTKIADIIKETQENHKDPENAQKFERFYSHIFNTLGDQVTYEEILQMDKDQTNKISRKLAEQVILSEDGFQKRKIDGGDPIKKIEEDNLLIHQEPESIQTLLFNYEEMRDTNMDISTALFNQIEKMRDRLQQKIDDGELEIEDWETLSLMFFMQEIVQKVHKSKHSIEESKKPATFKSSTESHLQDETFDIELFMSYWKAFERTSQEIKQEIDEKTGLMNRKIFQERFREWSRNKKQFSVIYIDLEYLKYFNYQNGREAGDIALSTAGAILSETEEATIKSGVFAEAFRTGGDEFSMLVETEDQEKINEIIEKIHNLSDQKGPIPRSNRASPYYREEKVRFGIGWISRNQALKTMEQLIKENKLSGYSDSEIENLKKYFSGQEVDSADGILWLTNNFHLKLADEVCDNNKAINKCIFLTRRLIEINAINDPLNKTEELGKYEVLVNASGKSLRGKKIEDFENLLSYLQENQIDISNPSKENIESISKVFFEK